MNGRRVNQRREIAISANVRFLMMRRGLSQIRLANLAGIHSQTICNLLKRNRSIALTTAVRIAQALDITLDELVYGTQSVDRDSVAGAGWHDVPDLRMRGCL